MQHWKVLRWATWLCPLVPSLGPFQLSSVYLTCRYLAKTTHRWYGGEGTCSSPAESNSVPRKVQSRLLRSTWASFTSEVRLSTDVDAEGVGRGKVASFVPWCEPGGVLFDCIGTWRAQIRVAGNLNLSINPGLDKLKCFLWTVWGQTKQSRTTGPVLYEFLPAAYWQNGFTRVVHSICAHTTTSRPHCIGILTNYHLSTRCSTRPVLPFAYLLIQKTVFPFFSPWGRFMIISSL